LILLDTHIWVWWADHSPRLDAAHRAVIQAAQGGGLGVSIISCWEVAKLVEVGRLSLAVSVGDWIDTAIALPGVRLLALTPQIAVESTHLPGSFHRDSADQILVATARVHGVPFLTLDAKILAYPHVRKVAIGSVP
jgi:PIN domain nuclease of toxin-antitoxin system